MFRFSSTRAARALVASLVVIAGTSVGLIGATTASATGPLYYVAMGDSLGASVGASPGSNGYVNQIYQHELARFPGLVLQNFSCSGATTSSVLNGLGCGATTTQLAAVKAFLKAHKGQVAFLTIDIGANDVDGCSDGTSINLTCITNGLTAVSTNVPKIVSGLKASYPGLRLYGMNYYDPFLAAWLTGPSGQTLAQQSVTLANSLNSILGNAYAAGGFATADVSAAFDTGNFALTGSYLGQTEPQNVANICNWTHMCAAQDIHANNTGHAVIAQAFEPLIDAIGLPDNAPVNATAVVGSGNAKVTWSAPAPGVFGFTGYVVTPYLGAVAQTPRTFNTTATTHTIPGLTNGQTYTFTVAAKNAIGSGPESVPTPAVVVGAPGTPAHVSGTSGSTTTATGSLTVSYGAGYGAVANHGSVITSFNTTCTSSDGGVTQSGVHLGVPAAPITVTGVTTAKTYTCTVTATNSRGTGAVSVASNAVVIGVPAAPARPKASSAGSGALNVTFKAPANNGDAITSYTATCVSSNGGAPQSNTGAVSPITGAALTAGKSYTCAVSATNSRGTGPLSKASTAVVA